GSSHARVGHRQGLYPKPSIQQDGGFLFAPNSTQLEKEKEKEQEKEKAKAKAKAKAEGPKFNTPLAPSRRDPSAVSTLAGAKVDLPRLATILIGSGAPPAWPIGDLHARAARSRNHLAWPGTASGRPTHPWRHLATPRPALAHF
ncbi:hypothetical protein, partial [Xanthomonas arboricola]|uniref:hypothetical protein n=1 Tax=Xanthomonas arboricola TaxID=56448 RepID=UPI0015E3ABE2